MIIECKRDQYIIENKKKNNGYRVRVTTKEDENAFTANAVPRASFK